MSETHQLYVVFFFEDMKVALRFITTSNIELSSNRKLIAAPIGAIVNGDFIAADTGISTPVMLVYPLEDIEPHIYKVSGEGQKDSAS